MTLAEEQFQAARQTLLRLQSQGYAFNLDPAHLAMSATSRVVPVAPDRAEPRPPDNEETMFQELDEEDAS